MKVLSEGYMAIATGPRDGTKAFDAAMAKLDELGIQDAKGFQQQLRVAWQVFGRE
jgi:hypothetical protein